MAWPSLSDGLIVSTVNSSRARAYIVDASIVIFRYYFAMPVGVWQSDEGYDSGAVYGYTTWLLKLLRTVNPGDIAVCFDESLNTGFRHNIYPAYKCRRVLPDDALAFQFDACKRVTALLGVRTYASEYFEADDLIATVARRCRLRGQASVIVSRDKDLAQVLSHPSDVLWDYPSGEQLDASGVYQKLGVLPHQVADYLALVGDSGDDIPGVPGVGPKTAIALLAAFGSWPGVKLQLAEVGKLQLRGAAKVQQKLASYSDQIDMVLQLTRVCERATLAQGFRIRRKKIALPALRKVLLSAGFGQHFESALEVLVQQNM